MIPDSWRTCTDRVYNQSWTVVMPELTASAHASRVLA
jgi:hypothetical protein